MINRKKITKGRGNFRGAPSAYNPTQVKKKNDEKWKHKNVKLMHERNIHKVDPINFEVLSKKYTFLCTFLNKSKNGKLYYDFEKSTATYYLSKAILKEYYDINFYLPFVQDENMDSLFDSFSHLSNEQEGNSVSVQVKEINNLKNVLLKAFNEHTEKLSKWGNTIGEDTFDKRKNEIKNENEKEGEKENVRKKFLCPCVPGRVNYIHILADLTNLTEIENNTRIFKQKENVSITYNCEGEGNINKSILLYGNIIRVIDVGVGANCIYPLLGNKVYNWSFLGVDINVDSLKFGYINTLLNDKEKEIILKYQKDKNKIFLNVIKNSDLFFFSMCNPPYHSVLEEVNRNPFRNLDANVDEVVYYGNVLNIPDELKKGTYKTLNTYQRIINNGEEYKDELCKTFEEENNSSSIFSANERMYSSSRNNEPTHGTPWNEETIKREIRSCEHVGGEFNFIMNMINESSTHFYNIIWFTTLVSKFKNVKLIKKEIIKSMRLYNMHKKDQVNFLNNAIKNKLHFDTFFSFKDVHNDSLPAYISQYRIFESYTGRITRWILCWSYYSEEHMDYIKKLFHAKTI
ncbi:conserved Plasmodium protein, unknown function [Plasmodium ovale]|uniref:Methyltransferase n=2 Tax=Plasmodium ovale TaxID=36330 RepID=A0A1A8X0N3_PLAOA|nr:conserved protein, unknown function [Plasmodium ovale curtisi]SBS97719.1 conserved protein, unknown function [Plasmodium ovale curtisi]SCP06294.1 conserved Plasmodium protein, unknown function [Plasmodium ovale]